MWLRNVHIPEYDQGTWTNHEPRRPRKLLMRRDEISRLVVKTREKWLHRHLSLYFSDGYAKVEVALARGKRSYDKRHALAEKQALREADRAIARSRRRRG